VPPLAAFVLKFTSSEKSEKKENQNHDEDDPENAHNTSLWDYTDFSAIKNWMVAELNNQLCANYC
jgi:hypothetical protein